MGIGRLNPLSGMGNREFVGIDSSGNNLKLVHVKLFSNKVEVANLFSQNISGLSDDDISKIIAGSFNKLKARNPKVISVMSSHLVITKNIEVPSTNPQEIKEIIRLQAGRHTPYSRDEIIIDYIDISTYKHDYTKILLIIAARNTVKRQFELLNKAGLRSEKVLFAPEGLAWTIPKMLKLATQEFPLNIAHIDEDFTDFIIVFKNKLIFIRPIPIGTQHLMSEKEKFIIRFTEEIKRSLEAYQSESIEKIPNMLVLTGAVQELKELEDALNNTLHCPVKLVPYFRNLVVSEEVLKTTSSIRRVSFLNVIASLLAYEEMKVDLVPDEIKLRKSIEKRGRELIKTGILILTIFVLIFSILTSKIYFKTAYLNNLDKKYKPLEQEAKVLENDFEKINMIKQYLSQRGLSLEVLSELYNMAPLELEVNDIRFDGQGKFSIRGTAESMSIIFSFVDSMKKSKYLQDVKTKYTTKRKEATRDVSDFEIACLLSKKAE
jgi:Tfp pilus assembly PilM family ATPase